MSCVIKMGIFIHKFMQLGKGGLHEGDESTMNGLRLKQAQLMIVNIEGGKLS